MTDRKLPEPGKVRELYWDERLSVSDIAERYDATSRAVYEYMVRHDISRRSMSEAKTIPEEDLLDDIIAGRVYLDMWPKFADYDSYGSYHPDTLRKRFGSWDEAVEAAKARLRETVDDWPLDPDEVTA